MASRPDLHIHWLHMCDHHRHSAGLIFLQSERDPLRPLGGIHGHGAVLHGGGRLSAGLPHRGDRRAGLPASQYLQDRHLLHHVCAGPVDYRGVGTVCGKGLPAALLEARGRHYGFPDIVCSLRCDLLYLLFLPDFPRPGFNRVRAQLKIP